MKKKNKIYLGCSSFLLPKNNNWKILSNSNDLIFSEYGDWSGTLLKADLNAPVVIVLFLEDLFNEQEMSKKDQENLAERITDLIKNRLKESKSEVIVTFSSWVPKSVVASVKFKDKRNFFLNKLFQNLDSLSKKYTNFYRFNLDEHLSYEGLNKCFDQRNWYLAHCRLSFTGLKILSETLYKLVSRLNNPAKKVLVLDCDNTLWGGIVGEDGIGGLTLGQDGLGSAYVDFQKKIKKLKAEGTILVLCSKNNESDVWEVFQKHNSMILKKSDIVLHKINWREKSDNILEISKELALGLDSFVFWDDNPIERNKVRARLKDVEVIEPDQDVVNWPKNLSQLEVFEKFSITKEDLKKTHQYQNRAKFINEKSKVNDEISYLKSIKLKPKIISMDSINIKRAVQLSEKTNQYNLRTIRYNESNLKKILKNNSEATFLVGLRDCYGDHGIVGMVCSKAVNKNFVFLDTFLMSCRVLGRYLESWMIAETIKKVKLKKYKYLIAEYIPTKKNQIAASFLKSNGFKELRKFKIQKNDENLIKNHFKNRRIFLADINKIKIPNLEIYK